MKKFTAYFLLCAGLVTTYYASAVSVVLCQEQDGSKTYRSSCPPGTIKLDEQKYYVVKQADPALPQVTMYYVPDCQWCPEIRSYFARYNIPIVEKNLSEDPLTQQELIDKAGELIVPTVVLDDKVYPGFFPQRMDKDLEGYDLGSD